METNDRMCDKSLELFNEELTDKGKIYEIIDSLDVQNGRDMTIKEYLEAIGNNKDNNRLLCDVYKDRLKVKHTSGEDIGTMKEEPKIPECLSTLDYISWIKHLEISNQRFLCYNKVLSGRLKRIHAETYTTQEGRYEADERLLANIRSLSDLDKVTTNVQRLSVRNIIEMFDNKELIYTSAVFNQVVHSLASGSDVFSIIEMLIGIIESQNVTFKDMTMNSINTNIICR